MPPADLFTPPSLTTLTLDLHVESDPNRLDTSSTSATSATDCLTPTQSEFSCATIMGHEETATTKPVVVTDARPKANKTFIIRVAKKPNLILTLVSGKLRIVDGYAPAGGWQWHCVKGGGWYGFWNEVSGTYIGHNSEGGFWADSKHHGWHDSFIIDPHEDGGYVLVMRHGNDLKPMAIASDGKRLVEVKEGGTAWEFIESHHLVSN